jgi:hypothetical protein
MFKLRDSDRFKKEYDAYKRVVDTITVETAQQHGYQLLNQLLSSLEENKDFKRLKESIFK